MKKSVTLLLSLSMIFALTACGGQSGGNDTANAEPNSESAETVTETSAEEPTEAPAETLVEAPAEVPVEAADTEETSKDTESAGGKTLVVYYSATGNTEKAANYIAATTGADTFELEPSEPYTDEDLDYNVDSSRVVYEHDNPDARTVELVESTVPDWESYDTVFIGYPNMEQGFESVLCA